MNKQRSDQARGGSGGRSGGTALTSYDAMNDVVPAEPFQVPYTVFSFDLETSIEHETVLCAAMRRASWNGEREVFYRGSEQEILGELRKPCSPPTPTSLRATTSTILTSHGWLTAPVSFSVVEGAGKGPRPCSMGPSAPLESELKRQRDALTPKRQSNRAWNLSGRVIMDAWWQARQALRPRRDPLVCGNLAFPDDEEKHKMDVDASNMDQEWAERPDEVMDYSYGTQNFHSTSCKPFRQFVERSGRCCKSTLETAANSSTSQALTLSFVWRTNNGLQCLYRFGRGQRGANHGQLRSRC